MSKIVRSSFWVLLLIIIGKLFSFLRDIFISSEFGSDFRTDAYFAANNIPSIIFTAIISSYLVLLIPTYKRIQIQLGYAEANLFVSRIINLFIILSIPLSFLGYLFIEELIYIVAPGFDNKTRDLSIELGQILILSFPFSSITTILATISNANNKYFAPHIIPLFSSLFIVIAITLFANDYGIKVLAVAGVLSFIIQLIIQILISKRDFSYSYKVFFLDENVKKMSILIIPIFLGFSIDQINLLVNSVICSNLEEGSLSSLNYAQRLQATINGTLSTAIITVIYPLISSLFAENKINQLTRIILTSLKGVFLVLIPIIFFLLFHTKTFVSIVYYRGEFDENALLQTSSVFFFYCINIFFISLREIILRIYYIKNNTKIPFLTSMTSLIINIGLSLILVKFLDVSGLALANLIATAFSTLILFVIVPKQLKLNLKIKNGFKFLSNLILPSLILLLIEYIVHRYIDINNNIFLFLFMFISTTLLYVVLLWLFKKREILNLHLVIRDNLKINKKNNS